MIQQPFFYDVTLRDGNQALKKPWNQSEKEVIFNQLVALGVQGIEIGFPASSDMDFDSCQKLAAMAPENVVVSVLARATENDITKAAEAVRYAHCPRIHTFIAMNPLGLEHVLKKDISAVTDIAVNAVKKAKALLPHGQVEFSVEHFGDCRENLPDVINAIEKVVEAGADVINLPNTVERFRPLEFIQMVEKVHERIGSKAWISVHCHNDLGMATATTVESFFHGATQLETTLNGLGERAGNTDMYQVAVALYNSGVKVPLNMHLFAKTAEMVSEMSGVPVWEKTPIIGSDVLAHRSGIHQDGANKTKGLKKGQYIAFDPSLIGREDGEHLGFTSQSGKSALAAIYEQMGYPMTASEAENLVPFAKKMAETKGELQSDDWDKLYRTRVCHVDGPYQYVSFDRIQQGRYALSFMHRHEKKETIGYGHGPIEACIQGLYALGIVASVEEYTQQMLKTEDKQASEAIATIKLSQGDRKVICRAIDRSTTQVSIRAIFNGLNQLSQ